MITSVSPSIVSHIDFPSRSGPVGGGGGGGLRLPRQDMSEIFKRNVSFENLATLALKVFRGTRCCAVHMKHHCATQEFQHLDV